ncbi:MAG: signal peptidase I [Nibricoccus sp.]
MKAMLRALLIFTAVFGAGSVRAEFTTRPTTAISFDRVLADAMNLAELRPGSQVMRIEGKSMLPFFGEGSVVVIKKIDPAKLRAGMVVVYTNRFGETVAHRLVSATAAGWVAQGYNNDAADSTPVNADNLIGVVYATFHSSGATEMASVATTVPSALAAPAR